MFRSEILKAASLTSTRVVFGVGVLGLLATQILLVTLLPALASGALRPQGENLGSELPGVDLSSGSFQYSALSVFGDGGSSGSLGLAVLGALALGLLVATTDYRFGGIVGTALAEPRRLRILLDKVAATGVFAALLGVVYAVISVVVVVGTVQLSPAARLRVSGLDILSTSARGVVAVVLLSLLGLGVGLLVRSQLAGFLTLGAIVVGEPLVQGMAGLLAGGAPGWTQLLPVTLSHAIVRSFSASGTNPGVALLVLGVEVAAVLAAAGVALRRRDL
ncbi:hypothetical protein GCM10025867_11120 [Frondihabitans sucicola]|uniref:ABC transporter permease n=1 Tax=Frondihabitans sucicola TaxID=1268041 RepID=A0ABN6XYY2_9MICO|nr:hypothetical protein [Frondihabitans sucicola]BDZ48871.1 hypothetical protein GCM10025867_11120 [Frondihabitans sucicola]